MLFTLTHAVGHNLFYRSHLKVSQKCITGKESGMKSKASGQENEDNEMMNRVKRITKTRQWGVDEAKIVLLMLTLNIGMAIPSVLNRGIWVRFVPEEFIGWFLQAIAVALYTLLFFHYFMMKGE